MKFIVDEIPKSKSKCPFSEWKPYPPIMEETGHYICKINHNDCNLCETECQLLKQERPETWMEEQEAVEPIIIDHIIFGTSRKCSKCNRALFPAGKYCPHCGRPVKWE